MRAVLSLVSPILNWRATAYSRFLANGLFRVVNHAAGSVNERMSRVVHRS